MSIRIFPDDFLIGPIETFSQFKFINQIFNQGYDLTDNINIIKDRIKNKTKDNKVYTRIVYRIYSKDNVFFDQCKNGYGFTNYYIIEATCVSYMRRSIGYTKALQTIYPFKTIHNIYKNRNFVLAYNVICWLEEKGKSV